VTGDQASVCGARAELPANLVPQVLALALGARRQPPDEVERNLRCTMQQHVPGSDHYAVVLELDGAHTGSVWVSWPDHCPPRRVIVLPDCDGDDRGPCTEFRGHAGDHTPGLYDPWADWQDRMTHRL